jgi:hypothetical protein
MRGVLQPHMRRSTNARRRNGFPDSSTIHPLDGAITA